MNKKILSLLFVSSLLLSACGEGESPAEVTDEEPETEIVEDVKADEEEEEEKTDLIDIKFTKNVEDGITMGDENNYADIAGIAKGASQINVIYDGLVLDVIDVESDGSFEYFSNIGDDILTMTFGTDKGVSIGDRFKKGEAENETEILFMPSDVDDSSSEVTFEIGETAYFESGLEIAITEITLSDEKPNGEIDHNFVRVDFTVDNQTNEEFRFTAHELELYDGERNKAELNSKNYYSETIASGMKGNGSAYFDSRSTEPFTVIIGPAIWESK